MSDILGQLQRNKDASVEAQRERAANVTRRSRDDHPPAPTARWEVKVIARRELTFIEDSDPTGLEAAIAEELAGGWRLVATETFGHAGTVAPRSTVLLFFERPLA